MRKELKDNLNKLSKEQLIYLFEKLYDSQRKISMICVEQSKMHISTVNAMNQVRESLYHMPSLYDMEFLKVYIDMEIGNISVEEYLKVIGLE